MKPDITVRNCYGPNLTIKVNEYPDSVWKSGVYTSKHHYVEFWMMLDSKRGDETNLSAVIAGKRYERKYFQSYTNRGLMQICAQLLKDALVLHNLKQSGNAK